LQKTPIFAIFAKNANFRKKSQFSQKTPIFAKMPIFAKTPIFAKNADFLQKSEGSGKVCKNREESFSRNSIFVKGFGEFRGNLIRFLQKWFFLPENRFSQKKFCKHFCNVRRIIPMG
jgi:hypothetical protein